MATAAFKSTSKRTPLGKSPSDNSSRSSVQRRSRSLSRFSHRLPSSASEELDETTPPPRGRFVNTSRGSGFPEISLDDLAAEFFGSEYRGRSDERSSEMGVRNEGSTPQQRRGRSVSRHSPKASNGSGYNDGNGRRVVTESNSRRRRSVSVARHLISDSESDLDHSQKSRAKLKNPGNIETPLLHKQKVHNHRQGLRRSLSLRDLKTCDDHSSQSSGLTDEEGRDAYCTKNGMEKTKRALYEQKQERHTIGNDGEDEYYEAMRKGFKHAVEEIRMEFKHAIPKTETSDSASSDYLQTKSSDILQAVSTIRQNYVTKMKQSEKRKQDLLAEMVLEDQRGRELSMVLKNLLPEPVNNTVDKPLRTRKKSNDRSRMSRRLTEEAERYIEDFISNVEDTDISSMDGERSDTSSSLGGILKLDAYQSPAMSNSLPVEMDGIVLPWLQWETSNDACLSCKQKKEPPVTLKTLSWDANQESTPVQDRSNYCTSSRGSCNPTVDISSSKIGEETVSKLGDIGSCNNHPTLTGSRRSQIDLDRYLKPRSDEDFLFERWRQERRISSGSLLLCNHKFF